jgi:hypothetical protein
MVTLHYINTADHWRAMSEINVWNWVSTEYKLLWYYRLISEKGSKKWKMIAEI